MRVERVGGPHQQRTDSRKGAEKARPLAPAVGFELRVKAPNGQGELHGLTSYLDGVVKL